MSNVKDFVVNILGDDQTKAMWDGFQANAGKAAAGAAAAVGAAQIGQAILGDLDAEVATDTMNAALGGTPAEAEKWANAAGDLYQGAWGESMDEAAGAVDSVIGSIKGMRDASEQDIQQAAAYGLDFAKVFKTDVADATGAVGVLIKEGLAKDAEQGFDLITAAMQAVPEQMRGETLDAVSEYSRNFAALGIDGERSIGILASAANSGITAVDKVGDALKELTIRGTDMSKTTGDAYETLGLDSQEMANALLAGGDTASAALDTIVGGLQGIKDPATQANTAIALFGTPLEDLGTDEIPAFLDSLSATSTGMGDVEGAAGRMSDTLNDNAKTRVEELRRGFEGWKQDMVETEGPLGDVAVGVQAFGADAAGAATSVGLGIIALSQLRLGALAARGATLVGAAATGVATAAQWAYNTALTANPIGLVIVAVAALVGGIIWFATQTEVGRKVVGAAWSGIQSAIGAVSKWFTGTFLPVAKAAVGSYIGFYVNAGQKIAGAWNGTVDFFKKIPGRTSAALSSVGGLVKGRFDAGRDRAKDSFDNLVGWVAGVPGRIGRGIGSVVGVVRGKFTDARELGKAALGGVVTWAGTLPGAIGRKLGGVAGAVASPFQAGFNAIASAWNYGPGRIGFSVPNWVPGVGGRSFDIPDIPLLAAGGIATTATLAMVGEGRGPEAIVPLDRIGDFLDNVNGGDKGGNAGVHIEHFHAGNASPGQIASELVWEMGR